ncbi:hypothetical protein SAMN05880590_105102 [Rhizobium sp. RU35A]|nr:hypothetical protein SAMN05880590_105102 [Rhizobium sp. RU35A]
MRLPQTPANLPLALAISLALLLATGFAAYGWLRHGLSIFLAMSDSLAAWCM